MSLSNYSYRMIAINHRNIDSCGCVWIVRSMTYLDDMRLLSRLLRQPIGTFRSKVMADLFCSAIIDFRARDIFSA